MESLRDAPKMQEQSKYFLNGNCLWQQQQCFIVREDNTLTCKEKQYLHVTYLKTD